MPVALWKRGEDGSVELQRRGRIDRIQSIFFVNRLAPHDRPFAVAALEEVVKRPQQMTSTTTPSSGARWKMFIFTCEIARVPAMSHDQPFSACRMFTPRSNPSWLTRTNSLAGP